MTERRVLTLEPVAKPRMTRRDQWVKRPKVVRYRAYCDTLRILARLAGITELPDELDIRFHLTMPPSWSPRKKESMFGTPHRSRPDLDNLVKGVMDALAKSDQHVHTIHAWKRWAAEPAIIICIA